MTKTTAAIITDIVEAYAQHSGEWVRASWIAARTGLTREELAEAFTELLGDDDFRAEPEPFAWRITTADRAAAPVIGGEARHLIRWG
jgi:hypothetical protein